MKLTGEQVGEIQEALLDAYPSEEDLRPMVRIELDESLEAIATGKNQRVLIFNLVSWAERTGRIDDLVLGAYRQNQGNPALQKLITSWRPAALSGVEKAAVGAADPVTSGPVSVDLFLSYSRKDDEAMHQVQEALRTAGLNVWTDEGLAPGTQSWKDAISEAVEQARAMVVLLSPNSAQSTWVKNEISFAQAHAKRIFPVLLAGDVATAVPIDLINAQWVDGRENLPQAVARNLLPELRQYLHLPEPAPAPPSTTAETKTIVTATPEHVPVTEKVPATWNRYLVIALIISLIVVIMAFVGVQFGFLQFPFLSTPSVPDAANPTSSLMDEISKFETVPKAGATLTNPKDGAVYVYVPAGPFIMGSSDSDQDADADEKPQQSDLYVDAFWIMRTEVTNAQYAKCVSAGACSEPNSARRNGQDYAQHPVTNVDWYQANEYARWVGGRLPTEAEWEKACRSTDGRIYPWGNEAPTNELANFGYHIDDTTPVGGYPAGASPYGVLDMAGNIVEWTSSKYADYPFDADDGREVQEGGDFRTLRGGSWGNNATKVRCAYRQLRLYPNIWSVYIGFRVMFPGF